MTRRGTTSVRLFGTSKDYRLVNVRPHVVAAFKKHRLDDVSPGTVKRELGLIFRILVAAERDFGIYLPQGNPVSQIKKPIETARDRRPTGEEIEILISDKTIGHYVTFAIETGMRRGEIVSIKPEHLLGEQQNLLIIPDTKTGIPRTIPLSARAQEALNKLPLPLLEGGRREVLSIHQYTSEPVRRAGKVGNKTYLIHISY
jgi:integrase